MDDKYYKLRSGNLEVYDSFEELDDRDKKIVIEVLEENLRKREAKEEWQNVLKPAKDKLVAFVKENGRFGCQSKVSESEYWYLEGVDGLTYKIRISGHIYPTGSMTNKLLQVIDTTDYDCREYLKIFGI